ncbi:MAG: hypothetical protein WCC14_01880 [Acidobacteriaceae bacterium]
MATVVCVAAFFSPTGLEGSSHPHPVEARVRFLATSTSMRSTYAGDEDVYLAEVVISEKTDDGLLVRLVDDYPEYRRPISSEILQAAHFTRFRLLRDTNCDIAFTDMPLRTAPGDPMAILPVKLTYRPKLPDAVQPEEILPCYRIVRR